MTAPQQLSMLDTLDPPPPPRPDYMHGRCDCGWILCGFHIGAVDQPGWPGIRHLWTFAPDGRGLA